MRTDFVSPGSVWFVEPSHFSSGCVSDLVCSPNPTMSLPVILIFTGSPEPVRFSCVICKSEATIRRFKAMHFLDTKRDALKRTDFFSVCRPVFSQSNYNSTEVARTI